MKFHHIDCRWQKFKLGFENNLLLTDVKQTDKQKGPWSS